MATIPQQVVGNPHEVMTLSNDETTRKYVNVVCKDTDILLISNKIDKSLREVGEILHLNDEEIKKITDLDGDHYKQIYSAFLAWSDKSRKPTWGELAQCLSTDQELYQTVTGYLKDCPPRIEGIKTTKTKLMFNDYFLSF